MNKETTTTVYQLATENDKTIAIEIADRMALGWIYSDIGWLKPIEQPSLPSNGEEAYYHLNFEGKSLTPDTPLTSVHLQHFGFVREWGQAFEQWHKGTNPVTSDWMLIIRWSENERCYFYQNVHHKIKTFGQLEMLWQVLTGQSMLNDVQGVQVSDTTKSNSSTDADNQAPSSEIGEKTAEAIAFADFLNKGKWMPSLHSVWFHDFGTSKFESKPTEELYKLFKAQSSTPTNK